MPKITPDTARIETDDGKGHPCGPYRSILFSDSGGLTQFGACVETLPPGSKSSIKHWHQNEDEMVYVLQGVATVHEGAKVYTLNPGEAATFKAGVDQGHCIENLGQSDLAYVLIGTRARHDVVTYPDNDRRLTFTRPEGQKKYSDHQFTTLDGVPAESPYKSPE